MEKPILYRVSGNKRILAPYSGDLLKNGFNCTEYKYTLKYEKPVYSGYHEADRYIKKFRKKKCKVEKIPLKYTRSTTYRRAYFKAHPSPDGRYRCVYCGGIFPKKDITIDHLIPVDAAEHSWRARDKIKKLGYSSVNDVDNLVCSCRYCNSKKGTKMGLWLIRGRWGRRDGYWRFVNTARIVVMIIAVWFMISAFNAFYIV